MLPQRQLQIVRMIVALKPLAALDVRMLLTV
jgi:hypothetical protein